MRCGGSVSRCKNGKEGKGRGDMGKGGGHGACILGFLAASNRWFSIKFGALDSATVPLREKDRHA